MLRATSPLPWGLIPRMSGRSFVRVRAAADLRPELVPPNPSTSLLAWAGARHIAARRDSADCRDFPDTLREDMAFANLAISQSAPSRSPSESAMSTTDEHDRVGDAGGPATGRCAVGLRVNGVVRRLEVEPWTTLLDLLRDHLDLTGAKKGCATMASAAPARCRLTDAGSTLA